eukprot:1406778-Prymnesium_polylepis.1
MRPVLVLLRHAAPRARRAPSPPARTRVCTARIPGRTWASTTYGRAASTTCGPVQVVVVAELIEDVDEVHRVVAVVVDQVKLLDGQGFNRARYRVPAIALDRGDLVSLLVDRADHVHRPVVEHRYAQHPRLGLGHGALRALREGLRLQLRQLFLGQFFLVGLSAVEGNATVCACGATRACLGYRERDLVASFRPLRYGARVLSARRDRSRHGARRVEVVPVDLTPIVRHLGEEP